MVKIIGRSQGSVKLWYTQRTIQPRVSLSVLFFSPFALVELA